MHCDSTSRSNPVMVFWLELCGAHVHETPYVHIIHTISRQLFCLDFWAIDECNETGTNIKHVQWYNDLFHFPYFFKSLGLCFWGNGLLIDTLVLPCLSHMLYVVCFLPYVHSRLFIVWISIFQFLCRIDESPHSQRCSSRDGFAHCGRQPGFGGLVRSCGINQRAKTLCGFLILAEDPTKGAGSPFPITQGLRQAFIIPLSHQRCTWTFGSSTQCWSPFLLEGHHFTEWHWPQLWLKHRSALEVCPLCHPLSWRWCILSKLVTNWLTRIFHQTKSRMTMIASKICSLPMSSLQVWTASFCRMCAQIGGRLFRRSSRLLKAPYSNGFKDKGLSWRGRFMTLNLSGMHWDKLAIKRYQKIMVWTLSLFCF